MSQLPTSTKVYLLTCLATKLQNGMQPPGYNIFQQVRAPSAVELEAGSRRAAPSEKMLNHAAILLTRGTKEEQNRSIAVIAVQQGTELVLNVTSTSPTSPNSGSQLQSTSNVASDAIFALPAPSHEIPQADESNFPTSENSPETSGRLTRFDVPSAVDTVEFDQLLLASSAADLPDFHDYVSSAFKVMRHAAQNATRFTDAQLFFHSHCFPKVKQRIVTFNSHFHDLDVLLEWKPDDYEEGLRTEKVKINSPYLQKALEPCDQGDGFYCFSKEHAPLWIATLVHLIRRIVQQVDVVDVAHTNLDGMYNLCTLLSLLRTYVKRHIPVQVWRLYSMEMVVRDSVCRLGIADTDKTLDDWEDTSFNDSRDELYFRPHVLSFLQGMHGMTAVLHAVTSMGKSLMKAPVPIRCSVLDLPNEKSPPITTADGVLDRLVIQCFPAKSHNEKHLVFLNAALRGAFQPKEGNAMPRSATETGEGTEEVLALGLEKTYEEDLDIGQVKVDERVEIDIEEMCHDTYHCEAGIMAASACIQEDEKILPDNVRLAFQDLVTESRESELAINIGVTKKICPTCWLLAQIISRKLNISFSLPDRPSRYMPWVPPPVAFGDDSAKRHLFEDEYVFGVDEDFVKFMTDQRKMSDDADSLQEKRID